MSKHSTQQWTAIYKLPEELTAKLGHVIVAFAYLEHLLSVLLYEVLNIGHKPGRLAIREPRASDRLEIISDLLELKEIDLKDDIKKLEPLIKNIEARRNQIAHGVWLQHDPKGPIYLRHTKGTWQPTKGLGKAKRIVWPEAVEFSTGEAQSLCKDIDAVSTQVIYFGQTLCGILEAKKKKS